MSAVSEIPGTNYLNVSHTVKSWLLTKDHKRIAILYLISITFFFLIGESRPPFSRRPE